MKEGWKMVKLGEVCEKITDGSHNPPKGIEHSNYFMLSSQNVQDGYLLMDSVRYLSKENFELENKRTKAQKGDVLLTIVGTIGRACVLKGNEGNITFQRSVALMKPIETLDSYYLMYYFLCQNKDLNLKANGAAQKGIYLKQLVNYPVILPPLEEQHRIVSILDASFEKIDALKANAEANLANAKALFQQVLAQELQPKEGWVEKKLEEIVAESCSLSYGIVQPGDDVVDGVPIIRPVDFNGKIFIKNKGLKKTKKEISDAYQRTILTGNEILMCVRGTTGTMGLATDELKGCNVTRGIVPILLNEKSDKLFVYYQLLSPLLQIQIAEKTKGAALKQINIKDLRKIQLYMPIIAEQHRIVSTLYTLSEKCRRLEQVAQQTIRECDALKQSILRQAFSGEL